MKAHRTAIEYRADVDGLRAVAVLAVMGYHAFPEIVRGGFVGVDIFFVISGYLISGIIITALQDGRFSFAEFYARRIRRIFPALALVLAACFAWGWLRLFSEPFAELGKHIAGGAGFIANFVLWREAGYFDTAAELKPLLHLWSLGVEEQFYLVWPALVFLTWTRRIDLLLVILLALVGSLAYNLERIRWDLVGTFYSPVTRFWELMSGAVIACATIDRRSPLSRLAGLAIARARASRAVRDAVAWSGVLLVAASIFLLDRTRHFPGAWALLPVGGTFLLIAAGADAWVNRTLMARPWVVWIGLISYPLYLWHWPLLAFARIALNDAPPAVMRLAAVTAAIPLAWATYALVESPIRFGAWRRWAVPPLSVAMAGLLAAGYFVLRADGVAGRAVNLSDQAHFVGYYEAMRKRGLAEAYRFECDFMEIGTDAVKAAIAPSCTEPGARGTWFLWGDSYAQALSLGIRSLLPPGTALAQVATSHCRPSLTPIDLDVPGGRCERANTFALSKIAELEPELVILAQVGGHEETDWSRLARHLKSIGAGRVVLVGIAPQWAPSLPSVVVGRYWGRNYDWVGYGLHPDLFRSDQALAEQINAAGELTYVSILQRLCRPDGSCRATVPGTDPPELIAFDLGHFTPKGSVYVAQAVLRDAIRPARAESGGPAGRPR